MCGRNTQTLAHQVQADPRDPPLPCHVQLRAAGSREGSCVLRTRRASTRPQLVNAYSCCCSMLRVYDGVGLNRPFSIEQASLSGTCLERLWYPVAEPRSHNPTKLAHKLQLIPPPSQMLLCTPLPARCCCGIGIPGICSVPACQLRYKLRSRSSSSTSSGSSI
jgi:hypothetical protein